MRRIRCRHSLVVVRGMSAPWLPQAVSISSGGIRAVGAFGILAGLLEENILDEVRDWYGCSGGSLCAFFMSLGVSVAWARNAMSHLDGHIVSGIHDSLIENYTTSLGVTDGSLLVNYIARFADTWEPGAGSWTFADLKRERPGVSLTIIATNVSRGTLAHFNAELTPTMRIIDAIRASSAIPFFYTPWLSPEGDLYADGGLIEYYPWSCIKNKDKTLVIACAEDGIQGRIRPSRPIHTIGEYLARIMDIMQVEVCTVAPRNWIAVADNKINFLDIYITQEQRLELFDSGVATAGEWVAFRQKALSLRTPETPLPCARPDTLSSGSLLSDKTSDSLTARSPQSQPCPPRDSHTQGQSPARRWSL